MELKVFVIIVTFNGRKWIRKCLNNLRSSTITLEVIVIDNGSIDGTQEFIESEFSCIQFIQTKSNIGFARANNIGIKKAYDSGANYIFLINQDVYIENNTIELLINSHLLNPEFGIISPIHLNGVGDAIDYNFSCYVSPWSCSTFYSDAFLKTLKDEIYEVKFVNAAAWLISRKCIEVVGGFNPIFFMYGEDDNYVQRLLYHKFKIGILASSKIYHDREKRGVNYIEKFDSEQKKRLLHYLNPNIETNISLDIKKISRSAIKNLLLLRIGEVKRIKMIIRQLQEISPLISKSLLESQSRGLSFLNNSNNAEQNG